MHEGHEVASGFLVAGGDAAALFQPGEEAFDFIAFAVHLPVVIARGVAVRSGRDDGLRSALLDGRDEGHLTTDKAGRIHRDVDYGRITTATRPANPALANAVESRDATATVTESSSTTSTVPLTGRAPGATSSTPSPAVNGT